MTGLVGPPGVVEVVDVVVVIVVVGDVVAVTGGPESEQTGRLTALPGGGQVLRLDSWD